MSQISGKYACKLNDDVFFRQVPSVHDDSRDSVRNRDDSCVECSLPVAVDAPHGALGEEGLCPAAAPDPTHEAAPVPDRDRRFQSCQC